MEIIPVGVPASLDTVWSELEGEEDICAASSDEEAADIVLGNSFEEGLPDGQSVRMFGKAMLWLTSREIIIKGERGGDARVKGVTHFTFRYARRPSLTFKQTTPHLQPLLCPPARDRSRPPCSAVPWFWPLALASGSGLWAVLPRSGPVARTAPLAPHAPYFW